MNCCTCYANGRLVPALHRSRWLGEMPICRACKAAAKRSAAEQAAAPPAPLDLLQRAFLQGADVSLTAYARPADAVIH